MTGTGIFLTLLILCGFVALFHELSGAKGKQKRGKLKPKKKAAATGKEGKTLLVKSKWSGDPEQFEATGGATFQEIVSAAARLASERKHPVKFGYNRRPGDKQYKVFPGGHFELTD